jgi:hypothetical protein
VSGASTLLPRTIRLDASDTVVFARAAQPGEWAVPGTFLFWGRDPAGLTRKEGIAFRSGFLGIDSFGHSTLVAAQPAQPHERAAAVQALARALVTHLGAPDIATALPAAEDEIAQAEALCAGHAPNTLIALHRDWDEGAIRERFRTLRPRDQTPYAAPHLGGHDRAFHVVEVDEQDAGFDIRNPGGV